MERANRIRHTTSVFDIGTKTWSGPKKDLISGPDVSIGRSILESLLKNPEHISQICDNNGHEYTNKDIATMSICVAQHLEELGIKQEDIIGICASNTDFLAPLVIGALLCGAILSTLDPSFDNDGMRHIFSATTPKIMFCDGSVYARLQSVLNEIQLNIPMYTMKDHIDGVNQIEKLIVSAGEEKSFKMRPLKLGGSQNAFVLCSSGTTGLSKGVCVSHEFFLNARTISYSVKDKLFCFSTLYWLTGVLCLIKGSLDGCTRIITDQTYSPEVLFKVVEKYRITYLYSSASQIALTVKAHAFKKTNFSSLEVLLCCGGSVLFSIFQEFSRQAQKCQILSNYGMSEVGGCSLGTPSRGGDNGKLLINVQVKIIDDSGNLMGIGEEGEVLIKPPTKWNGYYGNPIATAAIYDTDGWVHSGDIGYINEEGTLFVIDRKKDILKYNNFHFSPWEIEGIIIQLRDVIEVCVCGIPDDVWGFLPTAAIVRTPGSTLTEHEVINFVAKGQAKFKQLHGGVYFVEFLPKTASGKYNRTKVLKLINDYRK